MLQVILASDKNLKYYEILKALASAPRSSWVASPDLQAHPDHLLQQFRHLSDWKKTSSSTFCCTISSLDCRFGWERLSFSAGALFARQAMLYQVPVLARLCGYGSILCLKHLKSSACAGFQKHSWAYSNVECTGWLRDFIQASHTDVAMKHKSGERIVLRLSAAPSPKAQLEKGIHVGQDWIYFTLPDATFARLHMRSPPTMM